MSSILSYLSEWKIPASLEDKELITKVLSTSVLTQPTFINLNSSNIQISWYDRDDLIYIDHEYWGRIETLREYVMCEINRGNGIAVWRYTNRMEETSIKMDEPDERVRHLVLAHH